MRASLALLLLAACATAPENSPRLDRGLVAAPEPNAAEVGAEILRRGGNAVDAAIAVQFALAVTFPNAGNLGGGGFMLIRTAAGETAIDYRETAPAAAHRDMFLDAQGEVLPNRSLLSAQASGVPGTVAGMWLAHRKFGSLPWRDLLAPAIRLAEEGWMLDTWSAGSFAALRKNNSRDYFRGAAYQKFVQKELAATLLRIAERGRDGFYKGETARLIVAEMARGGGLITAEDLAAYEPALRKPVEGRYRGHRIVSMPPPSSGGIALLQLLGMMERFDPGEMGFHSAAHIHAMCEIEKRVFADRSEHLGDPDFVRVPVAALLDPEYLRRRGAPIDPARRSDPDSVAAGEVREKEQTTHFSIVDAAGNAVANTTTLNDSYGSGIVVRGAGFLLNNEMDDFSAKPGVPNLFGVIGREANAIAPRKRMLSSMTPTFVFKDDALWLVLGSPGGPTIFTTVFQVIVNRVDFGMSLPDAVAAPRVHHQWPPVKKGSDPILVEKEWNGSAADPLQKMGYEITPRSRIGDVQAIEIRRGRAEAACDPRGIGRSAPD